MESLKQVEGHDIIDFSDWDIGTVEKLEEKFKDIINNALKEALTYTVKDELTAWFEIEDKIKLVLGFPWGPGGEAIFWTVDWTEIIDDHLAWELDEDLEIKKKEELRRLVSALRESADKIELFLK